ncbi:Polysaccharide lyase family 14 protein [Rhodotorula toruloides ATCC 204091]|uniref:Polysaccharide lyase family 14 protein n=1 Tax=Rhodotorula toruloides TaxID=5286 RepID=A0A0K3CKN2_RHOTO|nr:Polysaccharide lyase family 14 protein [Rhodotorula toruloides ATCC 204091]KAK4333047.1 Polysaccharide lyase family 14 protein [Rhodotorula toruloides]PRQ73540.1 polysaccharide lyase family 14 protein [Rhodotorula toruloides]
MVAVPLFAALLCTLSLSESVSALPAVANVKNAAAPADSTPDSYWTSTGSSYYIPGQDQAQVASPGRTTPAVSLPSPSLITIVAASSTSSAPLATLTSLPSSLSSDKILRSLVRRGDYEGFSAALLAKRQSGLDSLPADFSPIDLYMSMLESRIEAGHSPTPYLPAQRLRASAASAAASKASVSSLQAAASSSKAAASASKSLSAQGKTTTTKKATSTTTSTKKATSTSTTKKATTTTTRTTTTSSAKPTSTSSSSGQNLGLTDGVTYWKEKTYFYSLDSFKQDVPKNARFSWGDSAGGMNVEVVGKGVPADKWTGGVQGDSKSALQVAYPAGSRNPSALPIGGMGFYTSKIDITQATNVSFSYSVFFPVGFDFVKGGKLPGLYGGKTACSGGSAAEDCFSTRLMFRKGGMGELYLYAPREKQVDSLCTLPPLSFCNSVYGMSIGRGSWTFKTGEWTDIRQDIWLNTPGKADGGFNIWINGRIALRSDTVYYRNSVSGLVSNGTSTGDIATLINYDSIPDDVVIPNGGFKDYPAGNTSAPVSSGVFQPTFVTKILNPTATSALPTTTPPVPYRFDNENRRLRRTVVELEAKKKRATVATIPGFLGAMAQTFFGGSTSDYNSPVLQYSYFRGFGLRIN